MCTSLLLKGNCRIGQISTYWHTPSTVDPSDLDGSWRSCVHEKKHFGIKVYGKIIWDTHLDILNSLLLGFNTIVTKLIGLFSGLYICFSLKGNLKKKKDFLVWFIYSLFWGNVFKNWKMGTTVAMLEWIWPIIATAPYFEKLVI